HAEVEDTRSPRDKLSEGRARPADPRARPAGPPVKPAAPPPRPGARPEEVPQVRIKVTVRGRSGERAFGGDNITEEIFRILKARFALIRAQFGVSVGGAPLNWPAVEDLAGFLRDKAKTFERLLPTNFPPDDRQQDDYNERCRRLTLDLW